MVFTVMAEMGDTDLAIKRERIVEGFNICGAAGKDPYGRLPHFTESQGRRQPNAQAVVECRMRRMFRRRRG